MISYGITGDSMQNSLECQMLNLMPANRRTCASSGNILTPDEKNPRLSLRAGECAVKIFPELAQVSLLIVRLIYKLSSIFLPEREEGAVDILCFRRQKRARERELRELDLFPLQKIT